MKNIITAGSCLVACFYWAQNYPVASIPENLKKNASAVIRNQSRVIEINNIDEVVYKNKIVITVLNQDAINLLTSRIYYDKNDVVSNIKVNVYDENGKKTNSYGKSDFTDFVDNTQSTFFSDSRQLIHGFTPKMLPVTVEFTYDLKNEDTVFIPDFTPFYSTSISLEKSTLQIINNSKIPLRTKTYESKFGYTNTISKVDGNQYEFQYENVPALKNEILIPDPIKILPKVSFSLDKFNLKGQKGSLTSWEDFGKWYYNNLLAPVSISTPEIKEEVAKLNLTGTTDEKVRKLFQYMQSKTRYIFISLGIGGWQPMLPAEVQKKGYGDCKALTNYMKTLLDVAGIKSYYSIIYLNSSPISFDKDFPKMSGNHVILTIPTEKGNIWLENTSQDIAYNHLSYSTTDRNTLLVKPNGIEILNTPSYTSDVNKEKQRVHIKLNNNLSIDGVANVDNTGVKYDFNLPFINYPKIDQEKFLKAKYSSLMYTDLVLNSIKNDKNEANFNYNFNFKAQDYIRNVGDDFILRAVPLFSKSNINEDAGRILPFEISHSSEEDYEITYDIPEKFMIESLPEDINIQSEFGIYSVKFESKNQQLIVKRSLELKKGLYSKEQFNRYAEFRNNIVKADNTKLLLSKKS